MPGGSGWVLLSTNTTFLPKKSAIDLNPTLATRDGRSDMTNWEMDLFDTRMSYLSQAKQDGPNCWGKNSFVKPTCIPISIISLFIFMVVFLPIFNDSSRERWERTGVCPYSCKLELVESIPENLTLVGVRHRPTHDAWMALLQTANRSIDIAAFYWTLDSVDCCPTDVTDWQGKDILKGLEAAGKRGVKIRIAQSANKDSLTKESSDLVKKGLAKVRSLNMSRWFGSGVLHTKLWIVDRKHIYIGSANMDWRALTQVKELGALVHNCPCLASDASKIFNVYWLMGRKHARIPLRWSERYNTRFNAHHPMTLNFSGTPAKTYIASSPPGFSPGGRENDSAAILSVISGARRFVHIAVMDYAPVTEFAPTKRFWPVIDNALRAAAFERGVTVRLLMSRWAHTKHSMYAYLRSLTDFSRALRNNATIQVRLFSVPSYNERQRHIPYARVNHNKYMVTDRTAYIGTSNWEADYFLTTGGVSLVVESSLVAKRLNEQVFMRDWNSKFAQPLNQSLVQHC